MTALRAYWHEVRTALALSSGIILAYVTLVRWLY
jgi:hypothetical protein